MVSVDRGTLKEIYSLQARRHRYILPLLSTFVVAHDGPGESLFIITPYAQGGDMDKWLRSIEVPSNPPAMAHDTSRATFIFDSIMSLPEALTYLHSKIGDQWCGHYDIKPHNIFLFQEKGVWLWKIGDFGLSDLRWSSDKGTTDNIGTDEYQPPEYHKSPTGTTYGPSFDVWSLGCVSIQLLTILKYSWTGQKIDHLKKDMAQNSGPASTFSFRTASNVAKWSKFLEGETKEEKVRHAIRIVLGMLTIEPENRLYAFDAALDFQELCNPDMTSEDFEKRCQELLRGQGPSPSFEHYYHPIIRMRSDSKYRKEAFTNIRTRCLEEAGWPNRPRASRSSFPTSSLPIGSFEPLSTLPSHYQEDYLYGREDMLERIRSAFAHTTLVALVGLGGIGKSHLAWQYAANARKSALDAGNIVHTFWVRCRNESAFRASYGEIAEASGQTHTKMSSKALTAVKNWLLKLRCTWILILDGVENANVKWLGKWCPFEQGSKPYGKILITTKVRQIGVLLCRQPDNALNVDSLSVEDGVKLLLQGTESIGPHDKEDAEILVHKLYLPILIKLIARRIAYLGQGGRNITEFAKRLSSQEELVVELSKLDARDPKFEELRAVKRVYELVFNDVFEKHPNSRVIFKMVCFFAHDNIDRHWMIAEFREKSPEEALSLFVDRGYIWLTSGSYQSQYAVHPVVQSMFRAWMCNCSTDIKRDFWSAYQRVLWMIYADYRHEKKNQQLHLSDGNQIAEKRQIPTHLRKLRYKDHVEEFLKYVNHHPKSLGKFNKNSADCLITFARWFDDENEFHIGQRLLQLVIDQGFDDRGDKECKSELQAQRDLMHSLTTSTAGRTKDDALSRAKIYAQSALKRAIDVGDKIIIWKTRRDCLYVLCRMYERKDALAELNELQILYGELQSQKDKHQLELELEECTSVCLNCQGLVENDPVKLEEARQKLANCIRLLENQPRKNQKWTKRLEGVRQAFASTSLNTMEHLVTFGNATEETQLIGKRLGKEAFDIYQDIWQKRQSQYMAQALEFKNHKHVTDARRDCAIANTRRGLCKAEVFRKRFGMAEDAQETLGEVLDAYAKTGLRTTDRDVRAAAYRLRETLQFLHKHEQTAGYDEKAMIVENKYDLLLKMKENT